MIQTYSLQGRRDSNEDQHFDLYNINNKMNKLAKINFLAVFDGHGGKLVSKYLKKNLPKYFVARNLVKIYKDRSKATSYFKKIFDLIQNNLETDHPKAVQYCGSTCVCAIIFKQDNNKLGLWVANVGDSRAILCDKNGKSKKLSDDHKPNTVKEKARIKKAGGERNIRYDGSDWRINDLSVSRAFGDNESKPFVSHRPELFKYTLNVNDKFIILACDGLWDVCSNQQVCNFIFSLIKKKYKGNYVKALAEYGYARGSYDNISVVILFL